MEVTTKPMEAQILQEILSILEATAKVEVLVSM
jgi:hypothetical protein